MTIRYAILGLLSWKPLAGYDMKKIFDNSIMYYWSGNNNQVYRTLVSLLKEDLVTNRVLHQENLPTKKIYSITDRGSDMLKKWILSKPNPPELRNSFLIQITWSNQLEKSQIHEILNNYENEIKLQLLMQQEKIKRDNTESRNNKERFIWNMVNDNLIGYFKNELDWINRFKLKFNDGNY